jgi:hypothetical protein
MHPHLRKFAVRLSQSHRGARTFSRLLGGQALGLLSAGLVTLIGIVLFPTPKVYPDLSKIPAASGSAEPFRELRWTDLASPSAQARQRIAELRGQATGVSDADARAEPLWQQMREWRGHATGNPAVDGQSVRITGYVVPLERGRDGVRSLLLVPYFGACIHAPPPPADQVIHIVLAAAMPGLKAMDVVQAHGRLVLEKHESDLAVSGYGVSEPDLQAIRAAR